ncbi:hypothetical protein LXL04_038139 [Taraxacum kok-saghyz]
MGEPSNLNKKKTLPPTKYLKTLHLQHQKTQIPTEGTPQTNQNNADQFEGEPPTHTPSLEQTPNPHLNNSIPKHPKLLSRIFRNEKTNMMSLNSVTSAYYVIKTDMSACHASRLIWAELILGRGERHIRLEEAREPESRSHLPSGRVAVDVDGIQIEPKLIPKKTQIKAYLCFFSKILKLRWPMRVQTERWEEQNPCEEANGGKAVTKIDLEGPPTLENPKGKEKQ